MCPEGHCSWESGFETGRAVQLALDVSGMDTAHARKLLAAALSHNKMLSAMLNEAYRMEQHWEGPVTPVNNQQRDGNHHATLPVAYEIVRGMRE